MKRTIALLVVVMAAVAGGFAQNQKDAAGQHSADAERQTLIDVDNKWIDALVKSDFTTLDSILADTYVDTDEHSHRGNKQDVMSFLKSGDAKFDSIKLSDVQVHIYGEAAVAIGTAVQAGNFLGGPLAANIIFTDTFVRQNGRWRAVASHRSVAAP